MDDCNTNTILSGKVNPAQIELRDTYLVISKTVIKTRTQSIAAGKLTAKIIPKRVATPFPPLNPANIGNKCPITAVTPSASS
jgi:hypothetical protein